MEPFYVDVDKCSGRMNNLPILIVNYSPDDIFNVGETGQFLNCKSVEKKKIHI